MELLLLLNNSENDRNDIQQLLRKFDCSLSVEDEKISIRTSAIMRGFDVNNHGEVSKVWDCVKDFVEVANGAALVEGLSMNPLSLYNVKFINESGVAELLPNIGEGYVVIPGIRAGTPDVSRYIPLALTDKRAAKVLRLCSRELDWVNLYRIYEVMHEETRKLPSKSIKAFTASANNSSVTGDFARHGKMKPCYPKETMRLADAQHLIKTEVREWINSKVNRAR